MIKYIYICTLTIADIAIMLNINVFSTPNNRHTPSKMSITFSGGYV